MSAAEVIILLDELIAEPSSAEFYGINEVLLNKLKTIRMAAERTSATVPPSKVVENVARAICRANTTLHLRGRKEMTPAQVHDTVEAQVYSGWDLWEHEARAAIAAHDPVLYQGAGAGAGAGLCFAYTHDMVEHEHPHYGKGYFCTPDTIKALPSQPADDGDARIGAVVWDYIDRMADHCPQDPAETILDEFVAMVQPVIRQVLSERRDGRTHIHREPEDVSSVWRNGITNTLALIDWVRNRQGVNNKAVVAFSDELNEVMTRWHRTSRRSSPRSYEQAESLWKKFFEAVEKPA